MPALTQPAASYGRAKASTKALSDHTCRSCGERDALLTAYDQTQATCRFCGMQHVYTTPFRPQPVSNLSDRDTALDRLSQRLNTYV
jgi:hypothetical protein